MAKQQTKNSRNSNRRRNKKKNVVRACKIRGWTVQPDALEWMEESSDIDGLLDAIKKLLMQKKGQGNHRTTTNCISTSILEELQQQQQQQQESSSGSSNAANKNQKERKDDACDIISAFQTPKLVWDILRKQFQLETKNWNLFGTAEDKIGMVTRRYALLQQRILRHELFRPVSLHSDRAHHQLTPIASLLGQQTSYTRSSSANQDTSEEEILLLGMLVIHQTDGYVLEDPTGQVPINLQHAVLTDSGFVTEGSILLVEGIMVDGILIIHRLGQPLPEPRKTSVTAIQQHVVAYSPYLPPVDATTTTDDVVPQQQKRSVVLFQDIHLDQPRVVQDLEGLLAGYENNEGSRHYDLPLFVLMGNFQSLPTTITGTRGTTAASSNNNNPMDDLLSLIAKFPHLAEHAHFCIVPGPADSMSRVLPLPPLPAPSNSNNSVVTNLHMATNPCRIVWKGHEMVICRYELLPVWQQQHIGLPNDSSSSSSSSSSSNRRGEDLTGYSRLLKTVLDQGHLVPGNHTVPVFWNYSHALDVYPMPTCLVLSDKRTQYETYGDCTILSPGSFAQNGSYAVYRQPTKTSDDDDDESPVEFGTVEL